MQLATTTEVDGTLKHRLGYARVFVCTSGQIVDLCDTTILSVANHQRKGPVIGHICAINVQKVLGIGRQ